MSPTYGARMSDEPPLFFTHLIGAFALVLLQLGRRSGLLEAVLTEPGTAEEIAARAGVDVRNAEEWLRGMTSAGYVAHDAGRFTATEQSTTAFAPDFPVDVRSILDGLWNAPQVYDDVVEAIRSGHGIPSDRLAPYGPFVGVNTPTYRMTLVDEWIGGLPGLADRLRKGARVAELAPGNGAAAAIVGSAFPASAVVGYDLTPQTSSDLPPNVRPMRATCPTRARSTSSSASTRSTTWQTLRGCWRAFGRCSRPVASFCWPRTTSPVTSTRTPRTPRVSSPSRAASSTACRTR